MLKIEDPKDILAKGNLLFTYDDIPEEKWEKIFKNKTGGKDEDKNGECERGDSRESS